MPVIILMINSVVTPQRPAKGSVVPRNYVHKKYCVKRCSAARVRHKAPYGITQTYGAKYVLQTHA